MSQVLELAQERRNALESDARSILEEARIETRQLTFAEKAAFDDTTTTIASLDARIADLTDAETRGRALDDKLAGYTPTANISVRSEQRTYSEISSRDGVSYCRDLITRQLYNDSNSAERLTRHAREVEVETRDISRVDGAGGEFVPPAWLIDQFAEFARAPRVAATLMTQLTLPAGTDQINVPRITTGPQVATQTADNAAVQETDLVSATVTAPVRTIAGQQDVALQLIEQSPINFDQVIFSELMADYERVLDLQLLTGTNASGQLQGVLGLAGIGGVTYSDATPTVPEIYAPLHQGVAAVLAARQLPPTAALTNSRLWAWVASQLDASNRPLVVPAGAGPNNAFGSTGAPRNGELGSMGVVPFFGTTSTPINLGAGTNETRIILGRWADSYLYEGEMRTRVLPDVLSGNLTVRLQAYKYAAVAHRFPASYCVISGTGLIMPAGF